MADAERLQRWLKKAEIDWSAANDLADAGSTARDAICFHCQQYVEKVLKALLVQADKPFRKIHDLVALLEMVVEIHPELIAEKENLAALSRYAVDMRYPDESYESTPDDVRQAMGIASQIRQFIIGKTGN